VISKRNVKHIILQSYKSINPKKRPTNEEVDEYIKMISSKDGDPSDLDLDDFKQSVSEYFGMDIQRNSQILLNENKELFSYTYHKNPEE